MKVKEETKSQTKVEMPKKTEAPKEAPKQVNAELVEHKKRQLAFMKRMDELRPPYELPRHNQTVDKRAYQEEIKKLEEELGKI